MPKTNPRAPVPAIWTRHIRLVDDESTWFVKVKGSKWLHLSRSRTDIPMCGRAGGVRLGLGHYGVLCPKCYFAARADGDLVDPIWVREGAGAAANVFDVVTRANQFGAGGFPIGRVIYRFDLKAWEGVAGRRSTLPGWPRGMDYQAAVGWVLDATASLAGEIRAATLRGKVPPCSKGGAHEWVIVHGAARCEHCDLPFDREISQ